MKTRLALILAASLAVTACDKKEEPAADAPVPAEAVEAAPAAEEGAKPAEGAAVAAEEAPAEITLATIGKPAPSFELVDESGKTHKLVDYAGKIVVLEWTNPDCPVVQRHYEAQTMQEATSKLGTEVVWLAVDSSHFVRPEDSRKWKEENKMTWPVLQDPDGKIGAAYGAKTTPHMYVVDPQGVLRYNGAIDDDPNGKLEKAERKNLVVEAVTAIAEGKEVATPETKPYGCSVKYKS